MNYSTLLCSTLFSLVLSVTLIKLSTMVKSITSSKTSSAKFIVGVKAITWRETIIRKNKNITRLKTIIALVKGDSII